MEKKLTHSETVAYVEKEMSEYRPCPLCGQYGGLEQHQTACAYLTYKGEQPASEEVTETTETTEDDHEESDSGAGLEGLFKTP